ncbi:hypothetical protein ACHAXM_011147 [Skeletonema potamos]
MILGNSPNHIRNSVGISVAAAVAAISIAWISSRRWKTKNAELLNALQILSERIDGIEAEKSRKKDSARRRREASTQRDRPKLRSLAITDENVKPRPNILDDDEDSFDNIFNHPPKSITTRQNNLSMLVNEHSTYLTRRASFESMEQFNQENAAVPIVLISDPGQDLDDEMMFIMARYLVSLDLISLKGVVANLSPSFARARLTRGTLDLLGLHRVPVGIGTDGGDTTGKHSSDQFEETAASYIVQEDGEAARGLESGHRLLQRLYEEAADIGYINMDKGNNQTNNKDANRLITGGLTLVITSSMKDAAIFVRDNPSLFASKTREVVVMGGCKSIPTPDSITSTGSGKNSYWSKLAKIELEPDSANNNTFDPAAAEFFYSQCQKMNITFTVVTRFAAYAAKMPRSVYDDLALTGSSIGWRLRNSQRSSIDQLWQRACSQDKASRAGLPPRCDRKWFIDTFCGGDDDETRCCADTAWDLVTGFMQYDTLALLAAVPIVREKHFDPVVLPPLEHSIVRNSTRRMSSVGDDSTVTAGIDNLTNRTEGTDNLTGSDKACGTSIKKTRRHSSASDPGPEALRRAIAQANHDNKKIEPFKLPGSDVSVAFESGTRNLIGITEKEHNLKDPDLLVKLLSTAYTKGILQNHHTQPHIILHMHLRWDNLADTLLTCLMLRSLWDLRLASVLGVIVSISSSDSKNQTTSNGAGHKSGNLKHSSADENSVESNSTLSALAESIKETLSSIGLSHVKCLVVSGDNEQEQKKRATEAFLELYESAPPIGVTLALTSTFSSVWPFAESHPELFRDKTVRVVHTGGALIWPARKGWSKLPFSQGIDDEEDSEKGPEEGELTEEKILVPDPGSQNHRLDLDSAKKFYMRVQALSVPMVVISRHVAMECCIPINFFDALGSHGGEVGRRIYKNERESMEKLWRCSCAPSGSAARGNLPDRCDAKWFSDTFCAGTQVGKEEDVWKSVESVNIYSPLALLAALPGETLRSYFRTMPFPVRSATHHVVGLTEEVPNRNVRNPSELRSLIVQSLLSAAIANDSVFEKNPPPKIPIRMDHEQRSRVYTSRDSILCNSVDSSVSSNSKSTDEYDVWTFSEAARRELFNKTVVRSAKVSIPKQRRRRFILATESRIAACSANFTPPETTSTMADGDKSNMLF